MAYLSFYRLLQHDSPSDPPNDNVPYPWAQSFLGSMVLFPITYVLCSFSDFLYTQALEKWLPKLYCTVVHVLYTAADGGIDKDASNSGASYSSSRLS